MASIEITVAYAHPDKQLEIPLTVPAHTNVSAAIQKSGILQKFPEIPFPDIKMGIFGKPVVIDAGLRDGDRIEIYRPLMLDPKEARRQRVINP